MKRCGYNFISKAAEQKYFRFLAKQRKKAEQLKDCYIKSLLCANNSLSFTDIPKELILLKRAEMELKRLLWAKRKKEQ